MNIVSYYKVADWLKVHLPRLDLLAVFTKTFPLSHTHSSYPHTTSGYWHGSVTVHQRQSPLQTNLTSYIREAHTLSKIRHESVQLFLGVCLDLHPDSVALVMR